MSLIRVLTDIGEHKPVSLLAKITEERSDGTYIIQYLSRTEEKHKGRCVFRYEDDTYQIDDESVTEYLNTDDETDIGYEQITSDSWIQLEDDEDEDEYLPSDEEADEEEMDDDDDDDADDEYDDEYGDNEEYIDD